MLRFCATCLVVTLHNLLGHVGVAFFVALASWEAGGLGSYLSSLIATCAEFYLNSLSNFTSLLSGLSLASQFAIQNVKDGNVVTQVGPSYTASIWVHPSCGNV